ncbi:MAG TPA: hypothetical protein VE955_08620, partial [Candidatus Dormibacteraeota bacterium]|nr:hypothetical protein [Candidatus Dormibacteraeota bacterium]
MQGSYQSQLLRVNEVINAELPHIAGLPSTSDLNSTSRFLYRISYPVWSGYSLKHDPAYVA